jgi:hypothetical protein
MKYVEIRVRPVVRYVITEWISEDDENGRMASSSIAYGEFDNAGQANLVAGCLQRELGGVLEECHSLRIHWLRAPGADKEDIRFEIEDQGHPSKLS